MPPKKSAKPQNPRTKRASISSAASTSSSKSNGLSATRRNGSLLKHQEQIESTVSWSNPFKVFYYAFMEIVCNIYEFFLSLKEYKRTVAFLFIVLSFFYYGYLTPGPHQVHLRYFETKLLWCLYWIGLGILSSVGFGSGLHTFVLYLGPHIARVTLAAFECDSLDFPEPPYPSDVTCPINKSTDAVTLWAIMGKVRLESLMWGAGTALGELPPYFVSRAARLSGKVDEEYSEYKSHIRDKELSFVQSLLQRGKIWTEKMVVYFGFPGILLFASIPNPLFDFAGMICGHSLVPFWTFFGATLIGKALVKMHIQMIVVIVAFSEHHVDTVVSLIKRIPRVGAIVQAPFREFLNEQKRRLHRNPGDPLPEQGTSLLQIVISVVVAGMIGYFVYTIIDSLAQSYEKRVSKGRESKNV